MTAITPELRQEGWGNPDPYSLLSKFHYFRNGMSLCGKWGFFRGDVEQGQDDHSDNCTACKRKKIKEGRAGGTD